MGFLVCLLEMIVEKVNLMETKLNELLMKLMFTINLYDLTELV